MLETALKIDVQACKQSRISELDFNNIGFGKIFSDHMFMADYTGGAWHTPQILPYGPMPLSPATSALHYGQSIFEGLKAYRSPEGEILLFRPHDNFKRLNLSAQRMCMPEVPEEYFMEGLSELLKQDRDWVPPTEGCALYIRPFMFATDAFVGVRPSSDYRFMIFSCPVGSYYPAPVKVRIEEEYTRAAPGGAGYAKAAGNYGAALLPSKIAHDEGYQQLIWTDGIEHKYVEESGTMNVMFIINGTLITPDLRNTILAGVTRDSVLQLARDWGMKVEERRVSVEEVVAAAKNGTLEEAFGTGTAATIAHIASIGYRGTDYTLPKSEDRSFSNKVAATMDQIKTGRIPDPYGWVVKIS